MDYIRYIEKTHEYYRSLGDEKTYNYAYNEDFPFTPLKKPLSESRVSLVTTASFVLLEEADKPGIIIDLPYVWAGSKAWMEKFMTDQQPFISEEAEAKQQELLQKAREQKAKRVQ